MDKFICNENCEHCKKKCIIQIKCKCEKIFCLKHRLPEIHKCSYKEDLFIIDIIPISKKINII